MSNPVGYRKMVEQIEEVIEEIGNDWECNFINDLAAWDGEFTDKQKDVIDKLYKRACESPH